MFPHSENNGRDISKIIQFIEENRKTEHEQEAINEDEVIQDITSARSPYGMYKRCNQI